MLQEFTVTQAKSNALDSGVEFILKDCIVMAISQRGIIVANDRESNDCIYVECHACGVVSLYDTISLQGKKEAHGNVLRITKVRNITRIGSLGYPYPEVERVLPDISTDGIYDSNPVYCKATGKLEHANGKFCITLCDPETMNVSKSSRKICLEELYSSQISLTGRDTIDEFIGHYVQVEGFWNGVTCEDGQEYIYLFPCSMGELYMYGTPSEYGRTSNLEMLVLDAVVAAKASRPGKSSLIVIWDPKEWGWVILEFSPSDPKAQVLADCKIGDKFDLLYGYVKEGEKFSFPRHIVYRGYYEGLNSGTYQSPYVNGPFSNSADFGKQLSVTYFEAIGTVNPRSNQLVLSDGYVMSDYCPVESSILFGEKKRTMSVRGYHLYDDENIAYCIFDEAKEVDYNDAVSIQGILSGAPGAKVRTYPVSVSSRTKTGFTVWENYPAPKGIYVDLSQMPSDQLPDLMPQIGSRVEVSGTSNVLALHTSNIASSKYGYCIGGNNVKVIKYKSSSYQYSPNTEILSVPSEIYDYRRLSISGKLVKEGKNYQLELSSPNQYIRIFQPDDQIAEGLDNYLGMLVSLTGYQLGYYGDMTPASPRYWYWAFLSIGPDFGSAFPIEYPDQKNPLKDVRMAVNQASAVPAYYLQPGCKAELTIPAGVEKISFYAVSNCKVYLTVGLARITLPGGFMGRNIVVDGSDTYTVQMVRKVNGQLVSGPLDKETKIQVALAGSEKKDSETFVYIFGIK